MTIDANRGPWVDDSGYDDTDYAPRVENFDRTPPYGTPINPKSITTGVKDRLFARFHGSTVEGWTPPVVLAATTLFTLTGWGLRNGAAAGLSLIAVLHIVQLAKAQRTGRFWFARPVAGALFALLVTTLVIVR